MQLCPSVHEGHGHLPVAAISLDGAGAQELLGGLVVASVQVTHQHLESDAKDVKMNQKLEATQMQQVDVAV